MDSKGMMAVVRGTPEAGLMVTLVDGGRQYTLMPQAEVNAVSPHQQRSANTLSRHSQYSRSDVRAAAAAAARCDNGAQAVDDRYTSNYKIEYCHTKPTSPPVELTEFPPQRAHPQPGQENFQVGGYPLKCFATRTISKCQERGSYPVSRISTSNAFENSLRKYPSASPESSSEVVERLISFTKFTNSSTSPIENRLKLQDCVTCYQVSRKGKCPKYKNTKRGLPWRQNSPPRDKNLLSSEGNQINEYHGNTKNTLFCKDIVAMGNVITNYRHHMEGMQTQQGGNVVSENVNSVSGSTKKSLIDIPISKFEDKLLVATNEDNQETVTPRNKNIASFSLQNVRSLQMIKSVIVAGGTKKKKNYCKLKKIKSPIQSHTKCKKVKHKPKLFDNDVNKLERKRLKAELLNLIRQFHSSKDEDNLELKIKTILYKLIDCALDTKKINLMNRDILKPCTSDSNKEKKEYRNSHNFTMDDIKDDIKFMLKNHTNDVTEIHRIILEEMIPLLKFHLFKEHENKVLKFILSKIIKDIVGIVRKIGASHSVHSKNSLEYRYHLNKLKEICGNKKLLYSMQNTSQVKKYCRYLKAIRKLVKNDVSWTGGNGSLMTVLKEPNDLKLRSIINIYRTLKRIQSTSYLQAQYVTNMLLNQFCNVGNRWNENYYGAVRKKTSALKCLSDTYLMLRDSSKNKSILTKSKIDKMNLYSTKLLTSIKNKCTIETNIEHTERNYTRLNANNPYKQGAICVNDISSIQLSFKNSKKKYDDNVDYNLNVDNTFLLGQVQEKVNTWLNKFGKDSFLTKNIYPSCNLKDLSKDLSNQLKQLKINKSLRKIKKENVADCLRCVICKHLFVKFDDHSFELVKKVSELIKDLLGIYTFDNPQLNLHHRRSQMPCTSIENHDESLQFVSPSPESRLVQAESSLIEDIYLKVPFCDESVRQVFPKTFSKEDRNNKMNETLTTDVLQNHFKYLDIEDVKNRSGVINVALASTKSDKCENTAPNVKCNETCSATCNRNTSNSNISTLNNNEEPNNSITDELKNLPNSITRQQLHEYCVDIFRNLCKELPILATNPDLTELAREGVLHNTLKIFYMLQEDPDVEKNCTYFELCFEEEIDGLLDILPQTEEMKKTRKGWTRKLVMEAVKIFKAMHSTGNTEFTEESNQAVTDCCKAINEQRPENEGEQEFNVLRLVVQFLNTANYQEQNKLKVKIYIQRLINRASEVYDNVKRADSNSFGNLSMDDAKKVIFKELESVPTPNCDITKEEMDLAKLNMEIEKWYNELPIKASETLNGDDRKLTIHELAQKISVIESCMDSKESSSETDMEQEICMFICNMIDKFDDKHLNIRSVIEELINRIRRLRQESSLDYETFKKDLPINSTMIHENITNGECCKQNIKPFLTKNNNNTLNSNGRSGAKKQNEEQNVSTKDNNTRGTINDNTGRLRPIAKTAAKGILGSQMPGTSQEGCCPRPRHSPPTASLYTPLTSSPRRNTYESDQLCDKSKWGQFSSSRINSFNTDRRASMQFSRMDHNQRPDDHSMRENVTRRSITPNSFASVPRQASSKILPHGRNYDNASPVQAPAFTPVQRTDNEMQRYHQNTFQIESERDREQNRVRCRCGDRHFRRRRRYDCCCEDYFSMPHCCLLPYEHYF